MNEEQPNEWYTYHHKWPARLDIVEAMEKCGQLPLINDNLKLIEELKQENSEK